MLQRFAAVIKRLALLALVLVAIPVHSQAGSAPASSSTVPGVFMGYYGAEGAKGYLQPNQPTAELDAFGAACRRGDRLWGFGVDATFRCTKFVRHEERGDGPVYELTIIPSKEGSDSAHGTLFSLKPLKSYPVVQKRLRAAEAAWVMAAVDDPALRSTGQQAIARGAVFKLPFDSGRASMYLVEGERTGDDYSENPTYIVIRRDAKAFRHVGGLEGEIVGSVDANGDGTPDVQLSIACDGRCDAVTSLEDGLPELVSVYNH